MQSRSSCRDMFMERANSLNSHLPIINACSLLHVALSSFLFLFQFILDEFAINRHHLLKRP